jgi:alkylated DNA repair dioxygenase AlkB
MPAKKASPIVQLPEGFVYQPDFLSEAEERDLLAQIATLSFQPFEFQGYVAKRRIVEYGWEYDFGSRKAAETQPLPDYLLPLRKRIADFADIADEHFVEAVVTEYPAGAPIGWHRDVPQFEIVTGISLRSASRMRFKPYKADGKLVSVTLEPRSLYILQGPARWNFQHSIPAVPNLRCSITFRTLRQNQSS